MISEYLLKALLTVLALLEDAVEVGMTPDAALNALENVSFELDQMTVSERREFTEILDRVAASSDPAQREWILSIPQKLRIDF